MTNLNQITTSINTSTESSKSTIAIFLYIDGVIFYDRMNGMVQERVKERFKGREHELPIPYPGSECDKAAVDLFDERALNYLDKLILCINKEYQKEAIIVLSSAWRKDRTIEFLKNLFKQHSFSRYIVDKTPELSCKPRGKEIAQWLFENHKKYNLCGFIVLDDCDEGLSVEFPSQFVQCKHTTLFREKEYNLALSIIDKIVKNPVSFTETYENKE